MNRREFIIAGSATLLLAGRAQAVDAPLSYTEGLVDQRLAAGETVFVDFYTSWCTTCRAQGRTISALRDENPAYDAAMTFVKVDWDRFSNSALANRLAVPRRSTLVLLRGEDELGRIVAGTRRADIEALMDLGLS